jgi:hypothetical protein
MSRFYRFPIPGDGCDRQSLAVSDIIASLSPTMTDFVRRLVSGDKARFKDEKLDLELGEPRTSSQHSRNIPYHRTSPDSITSKTSCISRIG